MLCMIWFIRSEAAENCTRLDYTQGIVVIPYRHFGQLIGPIFSEITTARCVVAQNSTVLIDTFVCKPAFIIQKNVSLILNSQSPLLLLQ
jgi:hypothetical protein